MTASAISAAAANRAENLATLGCKGRPRVNNKTDIGHLAHSVNSPRHDKGAEDSAELLGGFLQSVANAGVDAVVELLDAAFLAGQISAFKPAGLKPQLLSASDAQILVWDETE